MEEAKIALSVLCGGQSTEHEVSIRSARNAIAALNPHRYDLSVLYIDPKGLWHWINDTAGFIQQGPEYLTAQKQTDLVHAVFGDPVYPWESRNHPNKRYRTDCVFPLTHGTQGEDGAIQGLFDLLQLPYVGADTQSSAICIAKDITKRLLHLAKIPTAPWHTVYPQDKLPGLYSKLTTRFRQKTLFVKPARLGSSVGTVPVDNEDAFYAAITAAFQLDARVIVEPRIYGREIECSVLGNADPKASLPGEIVLQSDYYSYEAKYVNAQAATLVAPAKLSARLTKRIQQMAVAAFKAVHCAGMARVDFFITKKNSVLVNEINTIPGFTDISAYPKLWQVSGLSYPDLLDQLVKLALERHRDQQKLIRCYNS